MCDAMCRMTCVNIQFLGVELPKDAKLILWLYHMISHPIVVRLHCPSYQSPYKKVYRSIVNNLIIHIIKTESKRVERNS